LLKIWGFGAPDPYLVAQEEFLNFKYRFSYNRPVPAVLHACRESRQEFLESDDTSADGPPAIRRRDHPVYNISFHREKHSSSPIFFSAIDSFWGYQYSTVPLMEDTDPDWAWGYSGIASIDTAKKLRSLVLDYEALSLVYGASYVLRSSLWLKISPCYSDTIHTAQPTIPTTYQQSIRIWMSTLSGSTNGHAFEKFRA
jgi:hypothetical protein